MLFDHFRNPRIHAYPVEGIDGNRLLRISSLLPDEFAGTLEAYGDGATRRVLVRDRPGLWRLVPRPEPEDVA